MSCSLPDYDPAYCDGHHCPQDCEKCVYRWENRDIFYDSDGNYVSPLYVEIEVHTNCTVQVLKNLITGELSVGWWENE